MEAKEQVAVRVPYTDDYSQGAIAALERLIHCNHACSCVHDKDQVLQRCCGVCNMLYVEAGNWRRLGRKGMGQ